jgi:hypothetical protein
MAVGKPLNGDKAYLEFSVPTPYLVENNVSNELYSSGVVSNTNVSSSVTTSSCCSTNLILTLFSKTTLSTYVPRSVTYYH